MKRKIMAISAMLSFCLSLYPATRDSVVVYQKGNAFFEEIAEKTETPTSSRISVAVEKDKRNDAKAVISGNRDAIFCAIGPQAVDLAIGSGVSMGVAVGVANPMLKNYAANGGFDFVSLYPEPRIVFEYLSRTISAKSFGIIYTKRVNHEIASYFSFQAQNSGYECRLLGVESSQELVAQFPEFVRQVDITLLLIDPIAFSEGDLRYVVSQSIDGKKPVYGFSESVASAGVPVALFVPPKELSRIVTMALADKAGHPSRMQIYYSDSFDLSVNTESAKIFGVKYDEAKVTRRY